MIVPTTILSLAALSAAESNSSGKRGLRKSSTPWTAIAVVSGTALTAGAIGGLLGHFLTGSGSGLCLEGVANCTPGNGCLAGFFEKEADKCTGCGEGVNSAAANWTGAARVDVCKGCAANYYQAGVIATPNCTYCGNDKTKAARDGFRNAAELPATCSERTCTGDNTNNATAGRRLTGTQTCKCTGGSPGTCTVAEPICANTGACAAAA